MIVLIFGIEPAAIVKETARPVVKKVELNPCASSPCLNSGVCVTETDETSTHFRIKITKISQF